ncbi:hypothetical protein MIN45_P0477 [Methylomarinovum tepidoasis]|uniref:Uncharacterized protein n=1 Tax=Methylomarinovum tepidoasis TaxID=2840183 RepID=A0AAU9C6U9_9GAMM|nr:hypothetical protein [Methylomarinovum sp. IN45]BCX88110.1 hypothetical protein MIN45_P0477 [Methylomarinovum sp. IN45]
MTYRNLQSIANRLTLCSLVLALGAVPPVMANDLNDGIAIDDPIDDSLKPTLNVPFILMKAKAAELRAKKGLKSSRPVITQGEQGQGNITFGIGSKIAPGTTIINSSEIKNSNAISR